MKFKVLFKESNTSAGAIAAIKSDIGEPLVQPIGSFISVPPTQQSESQPKKKTKKKAEEVKA